MCYIIIQPIEVRIQEKMEPVCVLLSACWPVRFVTFKGMDGCPQLLKIALTHTHTHAHFLLLKDGVFLWLTFWTLKLEFSGLWVMCVIIWPDTTDPTVLPV